MLLTQVRVLRDAEKTKARELKKIVTIYKKPLHKIKKIKMILEVSSTVSNKEIYKAIGLSKSQFNNYKKQLK